MISHLGRTTLIIDYQCLVNLKKLAAEQRRTLSSVVDEFLRAGLEKAHAPKPRRRRLNLPVFDMGVPLVDLADKDALEEAMREL